MSEPEILALIESVNRRRNDGSVSPVHTPDAHLQLVADFHRLESAGLRLGNDGRWHRTSPMTTSSEVPAIST